MKITASFRRCVKIKRHCGGLATFPDGDMLPVQYHSRRLIMEHLIDRINWRMMEFYSGEDSRRRSPEWNRIGRCCWKSRRFCMTSAVPPRAKSTVTAGRPARRRKGNGSAATGCRSIRSFPARISTMSRRWLAVITDSARRSGWNSSRFSRRT